jgi:predicted metal-binding protein
MSGMENIEDILKQEGYKSFRWISGADVVTANWVRFKCMFGCPTYGKNGACPPNIPSVNECEEFFREYDHIAIIHFHEKIDNPDARHDWSKKINFELLELERSVFLAGYRKAFLLFMDSCHACNSCTGTRIDCNNLKSARPSPEAMAVDVFSTVQKCGLPIEVLTDYTQAMDRYAFLLVD